jgi:hypothetical protein
MTRRRKALTGALKHVSLSYAVTRQDTEWRPLPAVMCFEINAASLQIYYRNLL